MENESGHFSANELQIVARAKPENAPHWGERARLNSGGPLVTIVDIAPDGIATGAWRADSGSVGEITAPAICFTRCLHG